MKKNLIQWSICNLMATVILAGPICAHADDLTTNAPAVSPGGPVTPPPHRKHEYLPYHGKVLAINTKAMTLTVGTLVLQISAQTHITKDGVAATLEQGTVGEPVSGAYRKFPDGKLHAVSIHFGAHPEKKRKEMAAPATGTNGPAQ